MPGCKDYDGGIVINPYNDFRLEAVGGFVNKSNSDSVREAVTEARKIKGDRVMGKHTAAACYSAKNGNSAIVGSESGKSLITFAGGKVLPEYTIHNTDGNGFCTYQRTETPYIKKRTLHFFPITGRLAYLHK